jgi:HJR/Mrr/RecB family endonuclease
MTSPVGSSSWHELDSILRKVAGEWATVIGEACRKLGEHDAERFERLAEAAGVSASTFASQWNASIGDVRHAVELAQDLALHSRSFRSQRTLIEHALRATKCALRHHRSALRSASDYRDYEEEINRHFPDVKLVIDHAVYAMYVAWRPDSHILIPDNRSALLRAMAVDESMVRVVTPRQFEELVACLYECLGCRVKLTPETRDYGADILAWHSGPFMSETLIAVQVKRYAAQHRVGLKSLFELHGAVAHYQAGTGHIITTSDFTKPARIFAEAQRLHTVNLTQFQEELRRFFK